MEKNRQCTKCKKAKPESEFYQRKDAIIYHVCKPCSRKYNKKRYDIRKKRAGHKLW